MVTAAGGAAEGARDARVGQGKSLGDAGQTDVLVYLTSEELGCPDPRLLPQTDRRAAHQQVRGFIYPTLKQTSMLTPC